VRSSLYAFYQGMANIKRSIVKERKGGDSKAVGADPVEQCLKSAFRLLTYRPRSEMEIRVRLGRRFNNETILGVMSKLRQMKLIDDAAFAEYWKEKREAQGSCSKGLVCAELRQKGIDREMVDKVTSDIDEDENAYRAASRKASTLIKEGYEPFHRKLSAFLYRKGFKYGASSRAISRLWQELS
jgi:regulatory protein